MRFALAIPAFLFLASCSFASAQDAPDLRDNDPGIELQPQDVEPDPLVIGDLFADDLSVRIARAQIDADCMLADVQAEHDEQARLVLKARERVTVEP